MNTLVINSTATAQWHDLVHDAEHMCHTQLGEELQSYLVFLLMRYLKASELSNYIIAIDYLNGLKAHGCLRQERLRKVGDICLLHAGFFPGRAEKRCVRISYYVDIGISAYALLAHSIAGMKAKIFEKLSCQFVALMDVLQAIREIGSDKPALQPLQAIELWQDTNSAYARVILSRYTKAIPVKTDVRDQAPHYKLAYRRNTSSPKSKMMK
jgi:hypothetical protein